jgi:hypothetical protein
MLVHSFQLGKRLVKMGNHLGASRMLIRVSKNISQFPSTTINILTTCPHLPNTLEPACLDTLEQACLHTFENICQTHPQRVPHRVAAEGCPPLWRRPEAASLRGWVWQVFSNVWRHACSNVSRQVGSNVCSMNSWEKPGYRFPKTKTSDFSENDPYVFAKTDGTSALW